MENYTVQVESKGSTDTVIAWLNVGEVSVSYFHGWLMEGDVLNVGEIATREDYRQRGFASRLVMHTSRVLRVGTIQASVNSAEGEKLFASLKRDATAFEVDYDY